jgi:iron(III) transport system permease protein
MQNSLTNFSLRRGVTLLRPNFYFRGRRSFLLTLTAFFIVAVLLTPVGYLAIRALEAGQDGIDYLLRPRTLTIIQNSMMLVGAVALASAVIGVPFAWLTTRTNLPYRRVWLVLGLLPMVIPSYVSAVTLIRVFGPMGWFNNTFGFLPMPNIYGFFGAWLTITLLTYPYVVLPVRAAFMKLDPALEEAGRSLGQSRWKIFYKIILPQLRPALAGGMLLSALYALSDFGAVMILRYNAFTRAIFISYENSFNTPRASVLSLVLVLLTVILLVIERRITSRSRRNYKIGTGVARRAHTVDLGWWVVPAMIFCGLLVVLGVVVPVGVLLSWALNPHVGSVLSIDINAGQLSVNAVSISGATALIAGVLAIPLAILALRGRYQAQRWLVNSVYVGNALPAIVVGLALVYFGVRVVPSIYQTAPLLILGYLIRFVPFTLSSTSSGLTQINPSLEEAARGLGLRSYEVALRVTLPLVWMSVVAGMALVFLNTMKELPTTLMLRPTGFDTLATRIWTASEVGSYGLIGLPGLILMGVSFLSLLLILWRDNR